MTTVVNTKADVQNRKSRGGRIRAFGEKLIHSKHALWGIGTASFLESIIVPIPLETILIPLMQAQRERMFLISTIALLGCLLGASVGYAVGYFVFDAVGDQLISMVSTQEQFESVKTKMQERGFLFVFSIGVVPIPFQVAMLAAGVTKYSFWLFILASLLSRAIRYYGLAILVWAVGNKAQELFERHKLAATIVMILIILIAWGFALAG